MVLCASGSLKGEPLIGFVTLIMFGVKSYKLSWRKKNVLKSLAVYFDSSICLYEQKSSDITVSSDDEESKRGFTAAAMLPSDHGLLCVTADQQFFFYSVVENVEETELVLSKRLVGYNEEIADMKFLGDEEQFLAVATNLEEVIELFSACIIRAWSLSCEYDQV